MRRIVVLALVSALLAVACHSKIGAGSRPALLLDQVNAASANVHVGQEFSYAVVLLRSTSDSPVTIRRVTFTEPKGIGSVVKPLDVDVTPVPAKDDWPVRVWSSFPPTAKIDGRCQAQPVRPAVGAVIPPHGAVRLVVHFRAVAAGDYFMDGQDVAYTVRDSSGGTPGSIALPNRFLGTVTPTGGSLQPDRTELACTDLGNLPSG
jgi:hypothetical protein